jgi:hypothetical protein
MPRSVCRFWYPLAFFVQRNARSLGWTKEIGPYKVDWCGNNQH